MVRVFIADDHPVVRSGLKHLLEDDELVEVVGEAASSAATLREVMERDVDVLVLDLEMPGRGGLEVLGELREHRPDVQVLVLSVHPDEQFAVRALKAGAAGYLNKEAASENLVKAIKALGAGDRFISPSVAEELALHVDEAAPERSHEALSDREFQVLRFMAKGMTMTEIADELSLSVKTISTYRTRMLRKLGLDNNAQVIRYALENELV